MTEQKHNKKSSISRNQIISLFILVSILIFLFLYLLAIDTNLIIAILIDLFLFLFFYGLIYKGVKNSLSSSFFRSRNIKKSSRARSKEQYQVEIPKTETPKSLNFTYHRPLIRKCPQCGMILSASMKKCPNCGKNLYDSSI